MARGYSPHVWPLVASFHTRRKKAAYYLRLEVALAQPETKTLGPLALASANSAARAIELVVMRAARSSRVAGSLNATTKNTAY